MMLIVSSTTFAVITINHEGVEGFFLTRPEMEDILIMLGESKINENLVKEANKLISGIKIEVNALNGIINSQEKTIRRQRIFLGILGGTTVAVVLIQIFGGN